MANLLTGLDKLISDIAGPLLFADGKLIRKARVSDSRGGWTETETEVDCKVLVEDYSAFAKSSLGIPDTDRKLIVLGYGLSPVPQPGNTVAIDGYRWVIVATKRDPAKATYECQGRPDGVYEAPSTAGDVRVTASGDRRVTETGDVRVAA